MLGRFHREYEFHRYKKTAGPSWLSCAALCPRLFESKYSRLLIVLFCLAFSAFNVDAALATPIITSITDDSIKVEISWTPVAGATRYEVQVRLEETGEWKSMAFVGTKRTAATISGLFRSTLYYARVRASTLTESSPFSPAQPFSIGDLLRGPDVPVNLRVVDLSYKHITIAWNETEYAAGYAVGIRDASTRFPVYYDLWGKSSTNFTSYTLNPETDYYFTVIGRGNGFPDSAVSPELKVTTLPKPPAQSLVRFLAAATNLNGDWPEHFGAEGYAVAGGSRWLPKDFLENEPLHANIARLPASESFAPLQDPGRTSRVAASFSFQSAGPMRISCEEPCQMAFYLADFRGYDANVQITLTDVASERVMAQTNVSDFQTGIYLSYEIQGTVYFGFNSSVGSWTSGSDPLVAGIFFGGPVRTAKARLELLRAGDFFNLKVQAPAGRNYTIEKSLDFRNWSVRSGGRLDVPEVNVTLDPQEARERAFFRVRLE